MPRKKFQWTSELRHLLYDVYQARWTSYAFLAKRKDSLEEFISLYLKEKVVDLWPTGWMRLDELNREISRYKNAKLKVKEKPKAPPASASPKPVAPVACTPEQMPQAISYLKPIIPEEAETLEGGFYINCGALEFKNLTKKSYTTRTDAIIKMPERSRKRMISSSSESSSSSSDDDDDNDANNGEEEDSDSEDDSDEEDESDSEDDSESESLEDEDSAATAKSSSKYKVNPLAKRPKVIVTSKSKPSSGSTAGGKKPPVKPITTSSSSNSPRPSTVEISDTEEGQVQVQIPPSSQLQALPQTQSQAQAQALKKVVKTTTVKDMLKAKRDNFLKSQSGTAAVKGVVNGELKCISTDVSSSDSSDIESATDQGRAGQVGQPGKEGQESKFLIRKTNNTLFYYNFKQSY